MKNAELLTPGVIVSSTTVYHMTYIIESKLFPANPNLTEEYNQVLPWQAESSMEQYWH